MKDILVSLRKWFETSSQKQKLTAALLAFSLLSTFILFAMNGASQTTENPLGSTPLYFVSVFVKLIGVLLLIVVCSILFRRWMQPGSSKNSTRQLRLLETVRLSPKQAVHLVSIGNQQILIGATDQNISLLSQVDASLNVTEPESPAPQASLDFSSLLQTFSSQSSIKSSK